MKPYACNIFHAMVWLIFFIVSCGSKAEKPDALTFNPAKDKIYTVSILRLQDVLQSASSIYPERRTADTLILEGEWSISSKQDSLTVMKFTFTKLRVKETVQPGKTILAKEFMKVGREEFVFERDSLYSLLPGRSIFLTCNNNGQVMEVEGMQSVTDSLTALVRFPVYSLSTLLNDVVGNDAIKDMFNLIFYNLPAREIKKGERWGNELVLKSKAPVKYSNVFALDQSAKHTSIIIIQSVISATSGERGKTYLRGNRKGTSIINEETGFPFLYQSSTETIYSTDQNEITTKQILTVSIISKQ